MNNEFKSSQTIRQEFFDFFISKGHTLVPSASLVPENDPTLLFTNAGMNQFKDIFLNLGTRNYTRAVDTQKVMRVSGKHNDFDDVGRDTYHHTFFEMLGNWSFGDYYKKEAITWAWELLTKKWNLPKERLYATVYDSDDESFNIWKTETDIDPSHILRFGNKENFWEMGQTGPCGPCSEIHIDLTPDLSQSLGSKGVNADDALFIELWNLVFIQFNRKEDGSLEELPARHVDTGMGFERITAVLQNKISNYDTDLFQPIIEEISKKSGVEYRQGVEGTPHRVIADHIRALTFGVSDGIIPSNEGRGYVIRKILRRAVRFGKELGLTEPFLYELAGVTAEIMKDTFPELQERLSSIKSVIRSEEESFFRTLNKGFDKIKELITNARTSKTHRVSGDDVFLLYDSMGFPVDFTEQILKDENLSFDQDRFEELMTLQKERARASWKGESVNFSLFSGISGTTYIGSQCDSGEGIILSISEQGNRVKTASNESDIALVLDRTPFYGEKGGQIGDSGIISFEDNVIEIFDTKIFEDKYIHLGKIIKGTFSEGQTVTASVDKTRKLDTARNHSAAHLLFKALRTILGDHIGQAGSWVGDHRFRIDFTHPNPLTKKELEQIEQIANHEILANHRTIIEEMPIEQAKISGAVAAFEEKYGDIVRVVTMGNSKELCGGTHISSTGEIGILSILHESSVSAGIRRLEATTGKSVRQRLNEFVSTEKQIAHTLKCAESEIILKLEKLLEELKSKDKEIKTLQQQKANELFKQIISESEIFNENTILIKDLSEHSALINEINTLFKNHTSSGIAVFGAKNSNGSGTLSITVSKNLTNRLHAGEIIKQIAPIIEGNGGGKPDQAMAGGKNGSLISVALAKTQEIIKSHLS
ncbi:MAG: alanine--tRNA ligase [Brevinemataceae bacterium]